MMRPHNPSARDIAAWRKLIDRAEAAAKDPTGPMGDLLAAAKAARKAPVAAGALDRANPFVQLVRKAFRYVDETDFGRKHLCGELSATAGVCTGLMPSADKPSRPPSRPTAPEILDTLAQAPRQARLPYAED